MSKLVYGVGVNDSNYVVRRKIDGKHETCPYYLTWYNMLRRCYCKKELLKRPSYSGCSVSKDWLTFSKFKSWMEKQDWKGKCLDKDLLIKGNKIYSESSCIFVDRKVNMFLIDRAASRGRFMIGCYWNKESKKFQASCCNPFTKKLDYLGLFQDEMTAHLAWLSRKKELALKMADEQSDKKIADALRVWF